MKQQQVLFVGRINKASVEYKNFASNFHCIEYEITTLEQLIIDFGTKLKDIEAIYGNWGGFDIVGGFRGKLLQYCPPNLKIVGTCQLGYDNYDFAGMAERGIILTNVPSPLAYESVADLALYNTILSFRNFKIFEQSITHNFDNSNLVRNSLVHGIFDQEAGKAFITPKVGVSFADSVCGREIKSPRGNNVVIVGFGSIGKLIGQRLSSIGMKINYVKRTRLSEEEELNLGYKATFYPSIYDCAFADLVIIACPGTPATKHLFNGKVIEAMEKPFRVINIGRGSVVDENALVKGLKLGKVLFAGLDVFEEEPRIHRELIGRQDVFLTPHVGSSTTDLFNYTANKTMENIKIVLNNLSEEITKVN